MSFKDWINNVIRTGNLCSQYTDKVNDAMSKKELMDIVLDANGVSYLLEMQEQGMGLPYETITREFRSYINGRYVGEFKNEKGNGYNSKIYCCFTEDTIYADTTAVVVLGYSGKIVVPENSYARIYLDKNCDVEIFCPKSSKCIIEHSSGAMVGILSFHDNVELIDRGHGKQSTY